MSLSEYLEEENECYKKEFENKGSNKTTQKTAMLKITFNIKRLAVTLLNTTDSVL